MDDEDNASSQLSLSQARDEDLQEAPWQLEWKRPHLNVVLEDPGRKEKDKLQQQQQLPICHSSAALLSPKEVISDENELRLLGVENEKSGKYILNITLMVDKNTKVGLRKRRHQPQHHIRYADSMLLELVRHQSQEDDPSLAKEECVFSRLFRWPESALFEDEDDDDQQEPADVEEKGEKNDGKQLQPHGGGLFGIGGLGWGRKDTQQESQWKPKSSGLISACLCRLPAPDPHSDIADAMDVVQLLSLGGIMSPPPTATDSSISNQDKSFGKFLSNQNAGKAMQLQDVHKTLEGEYSQLVLCCLHSRGKVYVYSPLDILKSWASTPTERAKHEHEDLDIDMDSLFLGGAMLQTLQASYLPLTRPSHVIRLTVPLRRSRKLVNPHTQTFDTATTQQLLDASVWDSTVDGPSLPFRTKDNIPCLITHAFDLLCVAGPGRRVLKRNDPQDSSSHKSSDLTTDDAGEQGSGTFFSDSAMTGTGTNVSAASAALSALQISSSGASAGGFVSFISLRKFAPIRTVYLPFVPCRITPLNWGCMTFLLVIGEGGSGKNQTVAVAIRIDDDASTRYHVYPQSASRSTMVEVGQAPPQTLADAINNALENEMITDINNTNTGGNVDVKAFISIRRFQILPISLAGLDDVPNLVVGSTPSSLPPSLACLFVDNHALQLNITQRLLVCINHVPRFDDETGKPAHSLFAHYRVDRDNAESDQHGRFLTRIETSWDKRHIGRILLADEVISNSSLWCHQGQGWCLVGGSRKAYFVSWEGSNDLHGAYALDICDLEEDGGQDLISYIKPSQDQLGPFNAASALFAGDVEGEERLSVMFTASKLDSSTVETRKDGDSFLMDAIESISYVSYRQASSPSIHLPGNPRYGNTFSHEEKSERLLSRCSSWTALEKSIDTQQQADLQTPVVSARIGSTTYSLCLRSSVVAEHYQHKAASPFQEVLAWLACKGDYFTAASVALDLLEDSKTLRQLWQSFEKIDDNDDKGASKPQGLLDGVQPVEASPDRDIDSILVTLADMTVACLVKGAFSMSSTLRSFLTEDQRYDASRASLMLAATAARMLSADPDVVLKTMGEGYRSNKTQTLSGEDIVWPVRCLLQVGVARDNLKDTLMLLNATIPDELRNRRHGNFPVLSVQPMKLCKDLVSLILSSSPDAATLLLNLVDEQSRVAYWDSLEHETQLALATLRIDGKTRLLQEEQVRGWVLDQLQNSLQTGGPASSVKGLERMPNDWLRALVWACLESGGCDVVTLENKVPVQCETDDEWGILEFNRYIHMVRDELAASLSSVGIDYDIVVSALLLLESRGEKWCETKDSPLATQDLLNGSCFMAGRRSKAEPLYPIDGSTLMNLCYVAGNIQAGAHLVGGENGLILECTFVLAHGYGLDVDEAEKVLTGDSIILKNTQTEESTFAITDLHRQLLALLEQHVVGVRKYGDFGSSRRGGVDPVFAARTCLRAWLQLNQGKRGATQWIVSWLIQRLEISNEASSPHRLACAAFARALIWPITPRSNTCLAEQLDLPDLFVIQLSHACCGLVEAVP
ncbi:hypothetical protein ACA910_014569 [Epithemia clementina (nom. ined.)]